MATIIPNSKNGKIVSYKIRVFLGRDEFGKQICKNKTWYPPPELSPKKAEKAVEKAAAEWERSVKAEYKKDLADPSRVRTREIEKQRTEFKDFVENTWFPIRIDNGEHKVKTIAFYKDTTRNIVAYFKRKYLQSITSTEIQKYLIYLRKEQEYSDTYVHHHYRTLGMIFRFAVEQEFLLKNPMDKVPAPKREKKKVDSMTEDQAKVFLQKLADYPLDFRCMMVLMLQTGLRRGEVLGLQWGDFDEQNRFISINRNVVYTKESGIFVTSPKTVASNRVVAISAELCRLLKLYREEFSKGYPNTVLTSAFLFHGKKGAFTPKSPSSVTQREKRFMKACGLPDYSPHDLRHTCATLMLQNNVDIKCVQEILGHSNAATTLNLYIGSDIERNKAATDLFAAAMGM